MFPFLIYGGKSERSGTDYLDENIGYGVDFISTHTVYPKNGNLSITLNVSTKLYQSQKLKADFIIERYDSQDHRLSYSIRQDDNKVAIEGTLLVNVDNVCYEVETDKLWKVGSFHLKVKVYEGDSLILNETIPFEVLRAISTTILYTPYEVEQGGNFNVSILIKSEVNLKNLKISSSGDFVGEFFVFSIGADEEISCNITLRHSSLIPYDFGEKELKFYITVEENLIDTVSIDLRIKLSVLNIILGFLVPSLEFFTIIFYVMFSRHKMDELYLKELEKMGKIPEKLKIIEIKEISREDLLRKLENLGLSQRRGPIPVFEGKGLYVALIRKDGREFMYLYFSDEYSLKSFINQMESGDG
ncbi:MAG: hypothetical protein ACTSR0_03460 [Candidatus Asgardarchaeia archaeon]